MYRTYAEYQDNELKIFISPTIPARRYGWITTDDLENYGWDLVTLYKEKREGVRFVAILQPRALRS